jgi:DNA-binding transcriptional ArsR family regulator
MSLQKTTKAIADPTRREILSMLKNGRMTAGDIGSKFNMSGASVSSHLSILKEAGLVRDEREGKFIYYELKTSVFEDLMTWVMTLREETNN